MSALAACATRRWNAYEKNSASFPSRASRRERGICEGGLSSARLELREEPGPRAEHQLLRVAEEPVTIRLVVEDAGRLIHVRIRANALEAELPQVRERRRRPHRDPGERGAVEAERAERVVEVERVGSEIVRIARAEVTRAAEAPEIEEDEPVVQRERREKGEEVRGLHAEAVQHDARRAATDVEIVEPVSGADLDERHPYPCTA